MRLIKLFNIFLAVSLSLLAGAAHSETHTTPKTFSYHVDFNDLKSQTEALNHIQKQVSNKTNDDELKIILFGKGQALSLDANALSNTKIEYGNTNTTVHKKMSELKNMGVRFIICKSPTSSKRHYSTKPVDTTIKNKIHHLESLGYNCN